MSNLTFMQRNMLETMSEEAGMLYLRGCERDEWKACNMAWEWDSILDAGLCVMVAAATNVGDDHGVLAFIRERHFRRHFPDGRR